MKKILVLLAMVVGFLVSATAAFAEEKEVKMYFLPLHNGTIYDSFTDPKECGFYKKGEIYLFDFFDPLDRSVWSCLYDLNGTKLGYIKHSRTGKEVIFAYEGDDVRLIQKEKLRANAREIEENTRWQIQYEEEQRKKELIRKEQDHKEVERRRKEPENFKNEWFRVYKTDRSNTDYEWYNREISKIVDKYIPQIRLGMADNQVRKLLGNPLNINRSVGKWGVHEQWVIEMPPPYKTLYLYFENGILTTIQN